MTNEKITEVTDKHEKLWYVGDPCYIIPDDEWTEFCEKTWDEEHQVKRDPHMDSLFKWRGQTLAIWSNGGDGTWTFPGLGLRNIVNGKNSFSVDAGIFCVIALHRLQRYADDPARMGIIFDSCPELEVRDGVVFLEGEHDDSVLECPHWRCHTMVSPHDMISCEFGNCDEGCYQCFECDCCPTCSETEYNCDCGEEE